MLFNQIASTYRQNGFEVSWQKVEAWGNDITYTITVAGDGWHKLTDFMDGVGTYYL